MTKGDTGMQAELPGYFWLPTCIIRATWNIQ